MKMKDLLNQLQKTVNDPTTEMGWDTDIAFVHNPSDYGIGDSVGGETLYLHSISIGANDKGVQRCFLTMKTPDDLSVEEKLAVLIDEGKIDDFTALMAKLSAARESSHEQS